MTFRDDDVAPANSTGYLTKLRNAPEADNKLTWTLIAQTGYTYDPDPDADPKTTAADPFTADLPFDGHRRSRFTGAGSLKIDSLLGSRAKGDVTFGFKQGECHRGQGVGRGLRDELAAGQEPRLPQAASASRIPSPVSESWARSSAWNSACKCPRVSPPP